MMKQEERTVFFTIDKFQRRVEELGAGKKLKSGSKEEILQVIETVLSDGRYKAAASEISAGFKKSGGAKAAKEYLEKLIHAY